MLEHHITVSRQARYYTLGRADREVWFVLHGYGHLAQQFLGSFTPLDDGTRLIVAPEGLARFYLGRGPHQTVGASWMTREDRLAEIDDYVRYLDALHQEILEKVDRSAIRVRVLGFSQGSATACRWATMGTAKVDQLVVWGGEVPPDLDLALPSVLGRLQRLDLRLIVGRSDEYFTPKVVQQVEARLTEHHVPYHTTWFDGGHEIVEPVLRELAALPVSQRL